MTNASSMDPFEEASNRTKGVETMYEEGTRTGLQFLQQLSDEEIEVLRRLLLGPEQYQLRQLHRRLDELEAPEVQLRNLSHFLPEAVSLSNRQSDKLTRVLTPAVLKTLGGSTRQDRDALSNAVAPLMLPALRRSVGDALRRLHEGFKWVLQYGLSFQGIKWRYEAVRTGRSFSEVVLRHTLRYRVEQVFLIHRISGLPLQHVAADTVKAKDSALVSSMLTAIQDFVQDSFGAQEEEGLATLEVGDLTVCVEQGPKAIVAAVVRGVPTPELRRALKEVTDSVHLQFNAPLTFFDGDVTPFEDTRSLLEAELLSHNKIPHRPLSPALWILIGVLIVGIAALGFMLVDDSVQWRRYLNRLRDEPGIMVTESGHTLFGGWFVRGMRDPLSLSPDTLLAATSLNPAYVTQSWTLYFDLSREMVMRRARRQITPFLKDVQLHFRNDTLFAVASGVPLEAKENAQQAIRNLPGVYAYNDQAVKVQDESEFFDAIAALERLRLRFEGVSIDLIPGQVDLLTEVFLHITDIRRLARFYDRPVQFTINAQAVSGQTEVDNLIISRNRADHIMSRLIDLGLKDANDILVNGNGSKPIYEADSVVVVPPGDYVSFEGYAPRRQEAAAPAEP